MSFIVVDADTLIFSIAAVTEKRSIDVTHGPTGIVKSFDTRTKFRDYMQEKGKVVTEDYTITDVQTPDPIRNCFRAIRQVTEKILRRYDFDDVVFVANDTNNFRMDLPLPTRYKSNRDNMLRPKNLKAAHAYFKKNFDSLSADGFEADDLVTILANDALKGEQRADVIILSPDKDSRQSIGIKVGDYNSDELVYVEEMHPVYLDKYNKVKSYGIPWICAQMLVGDTADCYKPTELSKAKYGDRSAYRDLKDLNTPKECIELVISKYREWYPVEFVYTAWDGTEHTADWKSMMQLYYSCVRMKRSKDDELLLDNFFKEYGVKI